MSPQEWAGLYRLMNLKKALASSDLHVLFQATAVLGALVFAKLVGAVKEMTIAHHYGVSPVVDGYLLAFNLSSWVTSVLASIASFVLVPFMAQVVYRQGEDTLRAFKAELTGATLVLSLGAAIGLSLGMPLLFQQPIWGITSATAEAAVVAGRWLPLGVAFACLSAVLFAWLLAQAKQIGSLLEAVPPLGIGLFVWLFASNTLAPLVWGTIVGFAAQCLLLGYWTVWREKVIPRFRVQSELWREALRGSGLLLLAQTLLTSTNFVDTFLVARLGEGALSTYNYASRVASLALSLLAAAVGRAILPALSRVHAEQGVQASVRTTARFSWAALGIGVSATLLGLLLTNPTVALLFERGAFTAENTAAVSALTKVILFQSPVYTVWIVVAYWTISARRHQLFLRTTILVLGTKIISGALLSGQYGLWGVAVSTTLMYLIGIGYTVQAMQRARRESG